ncbi:hypothetical protein ACFHW2_38180 [Actinomadura sp. LOL_016]|uniref:hypothetical protein n=1 Tax=unclassified Actinomadura TaxID=2626254 RepID=UPI003A7FF834
MRAHGRDGHREIVERCTACARTLGDAVQAVPGLRLLAPVRLNIVCFTFADRPDAGRLAALADRVAGEAFLSPAVHEGVPALRAAFSNRRTGEADVHRIAAALREAVPEV